MRKLTLALGIVVCAACVNAATIKWGGDIAQADGATAVGTGSTAYLVRGSTTAAAAITKVIVAGTDWSTWTTDTGASIVSAYSLNSADAGTNYRFETGYAISGDADAGYYSIVVVDGKAGADGLYGSYNYAGQNTNTSATSGDIVDLTIGDNWGTSGVWLGDGGFNAVQFTAVPEPTSGLLILLGMAGLALKRKRA